MKTGLMFQVAHGVTHAKVLSMLQYTMQMNYIIIKCYLIKFKDSFTNYLDQVYVFLHVVFK